jgi:periplasmic protein TonB
VSAVRRSTERTSDRTPNLTYDEGSREGSGAEGMPRPDILSAMAAPGARESPAPTLSSASTRELFADASAARRPGLGALPFSAGIHVFVGLALVLGPLLWPSAPPMTQSSPIVIFNPPPPPPPPLALGSPDAKSQAASRPKAEAQPSRVTTAPSLEFTAPRDPEPVRPETGVPDSAQAGSPEGTLGGSPEGMIGGVEGGTIGGVPGGVLGGVIGGTGTVGDYDQPPRLIRASKCAYPREGFVKKIEGTVGIEILIDANGRVVRHRIVESIPALDRAAVECVYQWAFVPAVRQGRPVAVIGYAPVNFRMY